MRFISSCLINVVFLIALDFIWYKLFPAKTLGPLLRSSGPLYSYVVYLFLAVALRLYRKAPFSSFGFWGHLVNAAVFGFLFYASLEWMRVSVLSLLLDQHFWFKAFWGGALCLLSTACTDFSLKLLSKKIS